MTVSEHLKEGLEPHLESEFIFSELEDKFLWIARKNVKFDPHLRLLKRPSAALRLIAFIPCVGFCLGLGMLYN